MADTAMLEIGGNKQIKFEPLETAVAATEEESVILAEKLTQVAIPLEVLLQALNIAKYDKTAAFRYADNYLNNTKKSKWVVIKAASKFPMKCPSAKTVRNASINERSFR